LQRGLLVGSDATRTVGACADGALSCDGTTCVGEVLPVAEDCLTPRDDDCDGAVNEEGCTCELGENELMSVGLEDVFATELLY
jgi:hypothetical protein